MFDQVLFWKFCNQLKIESKEHGLVRLSKPLGSQRYFVDEISAGLNEGVHFFVVLKGRQLGVSTASLALDLFWMFTHRGLQGSLTTHNEESRDMFKSTLAMYMEGLPTRWRIRLEQHNRNQLVLENRSRFYYQIAGTRVNGTLGRGKGLTFLHSTETSSYGDDEGVASLIASLAETSPSRLYIFESTARGFNLFHDMYVTAKRAKTQRAVFIGWWRNELYSADPESAIYRTYWDGRLAPEEKEWIKDVERLYGYKITSRQVAWWRWKLAESIKDESLMYQDFPPTEDYAFVLTGTNFFSHTRCTEYAKRAKQVVPECFRYNMGAYFQDTECNRSTDRLATLKIWEQPVENAYYCIGADPSYGSSDHADRFCVEVFRCYADGLEQVAEFCTNELNTYQFAWVIAHLAGAYRNSILNLEVNGPGQAVINELRNLKRHALALGGATGRDLMDVLGNMQHYIWRKNDSFNSISSSIGWVTTHSSKERMLAYFKDHFERGIMEIRSFDLLEEMKSVVRDDGVIAGYGRAKDDRVIATAMACAAYAEQMWPRLLQNKVTRDLNRKQQPVTPEEIATQNVVQDYLKKLGLYGAR